MGLEAIIGGSRESNPFGKQYLLWEECEDARRAGAWWHKGCPEGRWRTYHVPCGCSGGFDHAGHFRVCEKCGDWEFFTE